MRSGPPVALTIAGSDSSGGAGIQADLKAFAIAGVHGATVVTSVTAQDSAGVRGVYPLPHGVVEAQLDAVAHDMRPRWAKTGMMYDHRTVRAVAARLVEHGIAYVVDPVTTASSGDELAEQGMAEALRSELVPNSTLLTPNVPEASALLRGRKIASSKELRFAAEDLRELGPEAVLVKGGHLKSTVDVVDVLCTGRGQFEEFVHPRLPGEHHGTGCTLSALVTAYLARGDSVERAVERAERVQRPVMAAAYPVGAGALFLDHMAPYKLASLRWEVARQVRLAARQLELTLDEEWLPEVGTNVAFALPKAGLPEDVAALSGRIHRVCSHARALGHVNFGASTYIAGVVLAAMEVDGDVRACANVSWSKDHERRAREAGLTVASFERSEEPPDWRGPGEWGTLRVCQVRGSVPDVIADGGGHSMEPQLRVLGREPAEVVDKIRRMMAAE